MIAVFLIFCRVGGCILIVPGLSSARMPPQVRLFIALAVTLALSPLIVGKVSGSLENQSDFVIFGLIASETVTGLLIGLLGRVYFMALQTMMTAIAMAIGFGSIPGTSIDEAESMPAIGSLVMMVATVLFFLSDLQWEIFRGLLVSYSRIPLGQGFGAQVSLIQLTDQISAAFLLTLQISSPFIVYSVIVNLAVGIANKLTPLIPVYFLSTPFVLIGGLFMIYFLLKDFMSLFMAGFVAWVAQG
nr:flagellar biosynthesis protein FliR [Microvirga terricola]